MGSHDSGVDSAYEPRVRLSPPLPLHLLGSSTSYSAKNQQRLISIPEGDSTLLNDQISYELLSPVCAVAILPSAFYLLIRLIY